jgi:TRAP-type C4-dicarboxylate transport system substrate-binding protein
MKRAMTSTLAIFAACTTTVTAAQAEKLVVTTNLAPAHWGSAQGGVPFMECVTAATNGEIEFDYFDSGKLASFFESLNAVNDGLAQISYIVVSAQSDKLPLTGITMLPGLGKNTVEATGATREIIEGDSVIAQEYASNRIVPLMINIFPAYQMLSAGEPFDSLQDLQGTKISSGGGSLLVTLNAVGASAIEMSSADLYLALQQGTIDGTMLSTTSVRPYKLEEVIEAISANGNFGTATGIWSIDSGVWEGLPEPHQTAFRDCGLKVEKDLAVFADQLVLDTQAYLREQGVSVYEFPAEELEKIDARLETARQDYVARLDERGMPATQAYEEYLAVLPK